MSYLENYLNRILDSGKPYLAEAIQNTVQDIVPEYISNFSFMDHVVSLLVGDVQSGKTSHMFGLMCAAADEGFVNFILLTTDNILLQQQTLLRAEQDMCDFCICGETDYIKFQNNALKKPVVIVLKKNTRILKKWQKRLEAVKVCVGNPLFIVDDEGDAASLNTAVNRNKQSAVNESLDKVKHTASSSIYLEVTGTPQALLLQTIQSGWKPYFIYYFHPGKGYLGGNFFFSDEESSHIILTDNEESSDIVNDDEFPENGLRMALISHLISSAHIMMSGGQVCNFLIHPSVKIREHASFAEKIGEYLNEIVYYYEDNETRESFQRVYDTLKETKADIMPFDAIYDFVINQMKADKIIILVMK